MTTKYSFNVIFQVFTPLTMTGAVLKANMKYDGIQSEALNIP
ncbi:MULTISPECIES: hypothetical protein [Shewanella]|nr:hypothetical protein [Shewanella basaltis]